MCCKCTYGYAYHACCCNCLPFSLHMGCIVSLEVAWARPTSCLATPTMLVCAMLVCVVLVRAVLVSAMLVSAMLMSAALRCTMLRCTMPRCAMLMGAMFMTAMHMSAMLMGNWRSESLTQHLTVSPPQCSCMSLWIHTSQGMTPPPQLSLL